MMHLNEPDLIISHRRTGFKSQTAQEEWFWTKEVERATSLRLHRQPRYLKGILTLSFSPTKLYQPSFVNPKLITQV